MRTCPATIEHAKVVTWATVAKDVQPTGSTVHRVGDDPIGPAAALAICQYANDEGFHLFYCDDRWQTITDTWHKTLDDAKSQAAFEYQGIESHWQRSG